MLHLLLSLYLTAATLAAPCKICNLIGLESSNPTDQLMFSSIVGYDENVECSLKEDMECPADKPQCEVMLQEYRIVNKDGHASAGAYAQVACGDNTQAEHEGACESHLGNWPLEILEGLTIYMDKCEYTIDSPIPEILIMPTNEDETTDGDETNEDETNEDETNGDDTNGDETNGDGTNGDVTNGDDTTDEDTGPECRVCRDTHLVNSDGSQTLVESTEHPACSAPETSNCHSGTVCKESSVELQDESSGENKITTTVLCLPAAVTCGELLAVVPEIQAETHSVVGCDIEDMTYETEETNTSEDGDVTDPDNNDYEVDGQDPAEEEVSQPGNSSQTLYQGTIMAVITWLLVL